MPAMRAERWKYAGRRYSSKNTKQHIPSMSVRMPTILRTRRVSNARRFSFCVSAYIFCVNTIPRTQLPAAARAMRSIHTDPRRTTSRNAILSVKQTESKYTTQKRTATVENARMRPRVLRQAAGSGLETSSVPTSFNGQRANFPLSCCPHDALRPPAQKFIHRNAESIGNRNQLRRLRERLPCLPF